MGEMDAELTFSQGRGRRCFPLVGKDEDLYINGEGASNTAFDAPSFIFSNCLRLLDGFRLTISPTPPPVRCVRSRSI